MNLAFFFLVFVLRFSLDLVVVRLLLSTVFGGHIGLSAGLCRKIVGSLVGKFSIFDFLYGGSGTLVCVVKESVKLYVNNIRTTHVELARKKAVESSLADARSQGIESKAAAKQAEKAGDKAAKIANKNANRILGPIVSSGWDLFEVIYY
ncbi:hypothetical protein Hanom_Chr03g00210681 [Helianthus anomalus]